MSTKTILAIIGTLLLSAGSYAQESRGSITGRVIDVSGAAIPGAEVKAVNAETGVAAKAQSNESGNFTLPYLTPGKYNLEVAYTGFKTLQRPNVEVRVNDVLTMELRLEIGNAAESIEVKGGAPLVEASNVSLGKMVDLRQIEDLPLQAGNANELVLTAPGVVNTTNLRQRKSSFNSASSQFSTNGNQLYSNEYTIDGVPDTFPNGGNNPLVAFQLPQPAGAEFKVQTSGFDAAVGHTPGAVLNTVTKSGTNEYHGELHEWMMNSALDASTFFQNASGARKPSYQDNRYGASVGGPVRIPKLYDGRNKTFFFYGYEGNKWGKPTANVGTVPTEAERGGDFSALLALGPQYQIYDPQTTQLGSNGRYTRLPFAGNIIPTNRIDPIAKAIQQYYPLPNTVGTAAGLNNYTRNTKDVFDYNVHVARVDHAFSDRNRAFVRLNYDKYLENNGNFYGNIASGLALTRINRGAVVDDVIVLGSNTILDLRYGLTHEESPERRRSTGFDVASLGFSEPLLSLLDPATQTFPNVYLNTKFNSK